MTQSGLELLALNLLLEGRGIARGLRGRGGPAVSRAPSQEEVAAAQANIRTPSTVRPHMRKVVNEASSELGSTLAGMQRGPAGTVRFAVPGLTVEDAYVVPNLARVFPGDPNPVRVTVYDKATGRLHSIALPSITALREAMTRPLPPSLEKPSAPEVPWPRVPGPKAEVAGPIVSPEKVAKAAEMARLAEAERKMIEARRPPLQPEQRAKTAKAAIDALERQIAERPGDARVRRWKRRLEKLKAIQAAETEKPSVAKRAPQQPAPPKPAPPPTRKPKDLARQGKTLVGATTPTREQPRSEPPAGPEITERRGGAERRQAEEASEVERRMTAGRRASDRAKVVAILEDTRRAQARLAGLAADDVLEFYRKRKPGVALPSQDPEQVRSFLGREFAAAEQQATTLLEAQPVMAVEMEGGKVYKSLTAVNHADVVTQFKIDPDKVASTGYIDPKTRKYVTANRGQPEWVKASAEGEGEPGVQEAIPVQELGREEIVPEKWQTGGPLKEEPPPRPAPRAPAPEPSAKRVKGKLERGDWVRVRSGSWKGSTGFVLEVREEGQFASVTVRLDRGQTATDVAKNMSVIPGTLRATEAELKRLESVEEPTLPRSSKPGEEPPPRPDVEGEVAASIRKRGGLRPIEEAPYRFGVWPSARTSSNEQFATNGHMLFMAPAMDPKIRDRIHYEARNKTIEESPEIDAVVKAATAKPQVVLGASGWTQYPAPTPGVDKVAVFHDPKSGQVAFVNADIWKFSHKAVSPTSYEQKKGKPDGPIVLKRDGKMVGLMMPMRLEASTRAELESIGGIKQPPLETHEARVGGAPTRRGPSAPPPPSPGRGIPIARQAPILPTKAEAKTLPERPVPPLPPEIRTGVLAAGAEKAQKAMHELVAFTNPVRYGVGPNLDLLMKHKGSIKRALFRTERAQKSVRRFWEGRSKAQVLGFWHRLESGKQADPRLAEVDEMYRQRADNMFKAISRHKQIPYWENWFPHMWKDPQKAREFFVGRRPMEGRKSFLKKRLFEDIETGIQAGLEPASWNPEEMMQRAEHNARKYVMVQELKEDYLAQGSFVKVRVGQKPPKGFRRLDQNWTRLYLNPEIELKEAFDKRIVEGLTGVADKLGIKRERKVRIGGGRLGYSQAAPGTAGKVVTRFATPESVLAHEIGHAIDSKYGLREKFIRASTPADKKELRALADLRVDPHGAATPGFRKYVRSGPEKMAVMLEALIHAPEEFRRVAPLNYQKFVSFLSSKPELAPLVHIRPSLLYGEATGTVRAGGVVLGGEIWAEENLARLLDNHMSRDFISETTLGRGIMDSRNTLNSINLGLSAFHATGTTLLAMMSRSGVGISEIAHGRILTGIGKIATSPFAPGLYAKDGWKFFRDAPELAAIEEALFTAGASLEQKQYYRNQMFDRFVRNARQVFAEGGTPYERLGHATKAMAQAPFAAVESSMRALTNYYIPQMKIGAFRDLFRSQLRIKAKDIATGKDTAENVARIAWRDVEDRMGLINYDNEFWHNTLKSSIMVLIRAPGWSLGTVRALGGAAFADLPRFAYRGARGLVAPKPAVVRPAGGTGFVNYAPEWTSRMSFALSMTLTTMALGAIYHWLHTGKKPETLEDYLHPQNGLRDETGRPMRMNFPTFMRDVEGWSTDPIKSIFGRVQQGKGVSTLGHGGKLAPEVTLVIDLLENQSYRGPIRNINDPAYTQAGQVIRYIFGREQPFSISQARRIVKEGGSPEQVVEQFFGITPHYPRRQYVQRFRYREPLQ